jgi:hypothetical protein
MSDSATSTTLSLTRPIFGDHKSIGPHNMERPTTLASHEISDNEPRLVLSIDIGTSQSAVAVFYCKRGKVERTLASHTELTSLVSDAPPIVTHVARWPGQEGAIYEEKVPSLLIYDADGKVCVISLASDCLV